MKKFTILTSLLALTACGGGSGGGSAPTPVNLNPSLAHGLNEMEFYTSDEETMKFNVDGNGNIVSLTTEDTHNGDKITFAHTTGNQFQVSNKYFYNLRSASEEVIDQYLRDHIGGLFHAPVAESIVSDTELSESEIRDQLITKTLKLFQDYHIEADENLIREAFNSVERLQYHSGHVDSMVMDVNSVGKDLQLAYSDFGFIKENVNGSEDGEHFTEESYMTYVGGYEPNKLETRPSEDMTFTGSAVAMIEHWNDATGETSSMLSRTDSAKLELTGGNEKLTMNFSQASNNPWYDVVINNGHLDITLDGEVSARINETYRIKDSMTPPSYSEYFETSYYTNGETVQEATAWTGFEVQDNTSPEGIEVNAAFGGKVAQ